MPQENANGRGHFYAIGQRIVRNKDFFERVWKLQPRFMAVFGRETADIFLQMHQARRWIEIAAEMLWKREPREPRNAGLYDQLESDVWKGAYPDRERIDPKLSEFTTRIEALCNPIINRQHR